MIREINAGLRWSRRARMPTRGPHKINSLRQNFKINFQKKTCYKKKFY